MHPTIEQYQNITMILGILALLGWLFFGWSLLLSWQEKKLKMPKVSDVAFSIVTLIQRDFAKVMQETLAEARKSGPPGQALVEEYFPVQFDPVVQHSSHKTTGIKWEMIFNPLPDKSFITISGGEDNDPKYKTEVFVLLRWKLAHEGKSNIEVAFD